MRPTTVDGKCMKNFCVDVDCAEDTGALGRKILILVIENWGGGMKRELTWPNMEVT
jgi:hypothetical protein